MIIKAVKIIWFGLRPTEQMHLILYALNCCHFGHSIAFYWSIACAGLGPAGLVPVSPLHLALFLGPLRPRKSRLRRERAK